MQDFWNLKMIQDEMQKNVNGIIINDDQQDATI